MGGGGEIPMDNGRQLGVPFSDFPSRSRDPSFKRVKGAPAVEQLAVPWSVDIFMKRQATGRCVAATQPNKESAP